MLTVGNEYFNIIQEFQDGMRAGIEGYLKCGKAVSLIKSKQMWKLEGPHVHSFGHFCKQVLHISPAHAHRMAQVYQEFGTLLAIPENQMDISKITLLLPYVHDADDEKKSELLAMAKPLSVEALKNNLLEREGKGELCTDICEHLEQLPATRCAKCGKWFLG
jgi:hypothetical protein